MSITAEGLKSIIGDWDHEKYRFLDKFSLVLPKGVKASDAENIHVVHHKCKDGEPVISSAKESLCGESLAKDVRKHLKNTCKDVKEIRIVAAKKQKTERVCGKCIAMLYADKR